MYSAGQVARPGTVVDYLQILPRVKAPRTDFLRIICCSGQISVLLQVVHYSQPANLLNFPDEGVAVT